MHTQGPWTFGGILPMKVSKGVIEATGILYDKFVVKRVWHDELDRRCTQFLADVHLAAPGNEEQRETAYANARIMAAAPALLSALKELRDLIGDGDPEGTPIRGAIENAKAAITKAEIG